MVARGSEKGAVRLAVVGPFRSETRFQKLLAAAPAVAASDIGATGSNADEVRPVGVCADGKMSWRRGATMAITDTHGERASSRLSPHTGPLSGCPGANQVLPHVVALASALASRRSTLPAS